MVEEDEKDEADVSVTVSEPDFGDCTSIWSAESVTEDVLEPCCSQDCLLEHSSDSDDDLFYVSSLDDSASSVWNVDDDDDDDIDYLPVSNVWCCTESEKVIIVNVMPKC